MTKPKKKKKTNKGKKYQKPITLHPLKPEQVLKALLKDKPEKKKKEEEG